MWLVNDEWHRKTYFKFGFRADLHSVKNLEENRWRNGGDYKTNDTGKHISFSDFRSRHAFCKNLEETDDEKVVSKWRVTQENIF